MAKKQTADEPLPRRVDGPSLDDIWLDPEKQRIRAAMEPLCYLLTDPEGLRMIAAGLMPEHLQEQAKRALACYGEGAA